MRRTKSHMLGDRYQKDKNSIATITIQIEYKQEHPINRHVKLQELGFALYNPHFNQNSEKKIS